MALINCPECNHKISDTAKKCPKCGYPINNSSVKNKKAYFVIGTVVLVVVIGVFTIFQAKKPISFSKKEEIELTDAVGDIDEKNAVQSTENNIDNVSETRNSEVFLDDADYEEDEIHRYEIIVDDVTWTEAANKCRQKGGYLANIGFEEEYIYIVQQIESEGKRGNTFWIGGERDLNSYDYHWVRKNGDHSNYAVNGYAELDDFWMSGEPSFENDETVENKMNMFYRKSEDRYVWNDAPDNILEVVPYYSGTIGYICEYDD